VPGLLHVRFAVWTKWTLLAVAAGAGAAALTFNRGFGPEPEPARMAAPAPTAAPMPVPTESAPPPARDTPAATGSVREPGLQPVERERPPAIAAAAAPAPYRLSFRREPGRLVLSGSIPDAATRQEVAALARERFFQERIVDETRILPGAPQGFAAGARFALDQLSHLASGEAALAGTALTIEGESLYAEAAEEIARKVRRAPGGFTGSAEIRIRDAEAGETH
jgi:hypothetical protein